MLMKRLLAVAALGLMMTGPAFAQGYPPIPPPRAEAVPPPPGTNYVWEGGHWRWTGAQYVWAPGHYVIRRASYHEWVPGHWRDRYGRWVWVPAHWR
jgi:YXWGXW repeat-containing protein